ncbi:hypothetical protein DOY81_015028, partial [Sarcophaga bullata]
TFEMKFSVSKRQMNSNAGQGNQDSIYQATQFQKGLWRASTTLYSDKVTNCFDDSEADTMSTSYASSRFSDTLLHKLSVEPKGLTAHKF